MGVKFQGKLITELTHREFFDAVHIAIESKKFDEAEELRDYVSPVFAEHLTELYLETQDWWQKELIIHMVQDQLSDHFSTIMHDAINAPSAESKAYSICFREKDRSLLEKYTVNYEVSPHMVEEDVKKYITKKKSWWKFWK